MILSWIRSRKDLLREIKRSHEIIDQQRHELRALQNFRHGETEGVAHLGSQRGSR